MLLKPVLTLSSARLPHLLLSVSIFLGLTCWNSSGSAEETPKPAKSEEEITAQLGILIRTSEQQALAGNPEKALETLEKAKMIAVEAKRPEVNLIEARIIRLKSTTGATPSAAPSETPAAPAAPATPAAPADLTTPPIVPAQPESNTAAKAEGNKTVAEAEKGIKLTQDECVEIAIQNNLGLKISRLTDRSSDLVLRQAWSKYLPSFTLEADNTGAQVAGAHSNSDSASGSITQTSPWGTTLSFVTTEAEDHFGANQKTSSYEVDLKQPLWRGAGLDVGMHDIRAARLNKFISRGNLELSVQRLIFSVRSGYADCIRQLQNIEVNTQAVASADKFLKLTRAKEENGLVTKLDVFNAEVQLGNRQQTLTTNMADRDRAFDLLKQIMDVDLEENVEVIEKPVDFGENPAEGEEKVIETDRDAGTVTLVTRKKGEAQPQTAVMFQAERYDEKVILDEALANRIDLLNSRFSVAIQKLNALLAKDGLGHQIDLTASYSRSGTGATWSDSHGYEDHDYAVGVKMTLPWGKVSDRVAYEQALLDLQHAEIDLKRARTQVQADVRDSLRSIHESVESILIQGKTVEQAKRSVEASRISFERGLKDSFDVIRTEDNLLTAKTDFINRRLDYVVRLAQLETVVGKATGRVDLSTHRPGGIIDSTLPVELKAHGMPKPAPEADPRPEDDPFEYRKHKK